MGLTVTDHELYGEKRASQKLHLPACL